MPESPQIFFGRQPILDREQRLVAYQLFFRDGLASTCADITDPTQATATVIANAFTELASNNALGPYRCFISIDHDLLFSDLIEALPAQLVALEVLAAIAPTGEVVARCQQLHERGLTLVIHGMVDEAYRPLLALADIVKVDIMKIDDERLGWLVPQLKTLGKTLLAEKVESAEQFALCQTLGFDLFQGYYFARPTIIVGKKLNPSQLALVRLLGLVLEDAETSAIENAFKLEPGLTVNMLRLTNSVSSGLATKITSLRHAIAILGRRQLQRWLQLLIYSGDATQGIDPLLQLAATRGRLMELLADHAHVSHREFSDQAFMVGIISLMPALLGTEMAELLEQLPVAPRVKQALSGHGGALGPLLQLVEATEQSDPQVLEEALSHHPAINADLLGKCLSLALSWANNLGQEQDAAR
ncbi:MAG: hypothetical protein H6R17_2502 [Proteobacteria bacterium]|nr:hypothetical protein [Pseudomonadota bacterium]